MAGIPVAARAFKRPTQKQIADALGVTQQAVSSWLRGEVAPAPRHRQRLEELYGIPAADWDVVDETPTDDVTAARADADDAA